MRELPLSEGNISVCGVISYASQEPWLFSSSVQQNILFGSPMDKERYDKVYTKEKNILILSVNSFQFNHKPDYKCMCIENGFRTIALW